MQCREGEDNYQGDVYHPERDAESPLDAALPTVEALRGEVVSGLELNIGDGCCHMARGLTHIGLLVVCAIALFSCNLRRRAAGHQGS